jgi:chromosome segregation ATPase
VSDTQILQGEIEALQEAVLLTDERVDEIEEESETPAVVSLEAPDVASHVIEVDLAEKIGFLEAEIIECRRQLEEQSLTLALQSSQISTLTDQSPEVEETQEVMEVIPEPTTEENSPSEGEDAPKSKQMNWFEKFLLIR